MSIDVSRAANDRIQIYKNGEAQTVSWNGTYTNKNAFYDGSAGHHENYEEKTGLAVSDDLKNWEVLSTDEPVVLSPHATGSLRYIDAQHVGDEIIFIYELTRENGAHEMRMQKFSAADFSLD